MLNQTQQELVRKVLWPITKESIEQRVTDNTLLYTRTNPNKTWMNNDKHQKEEKVNFNKVEAAEDDGIMTQEKYETLSMEEKHKYLDEKIRLMKQESRKEQGDVLEKAKKLINYSTE